ncbi:MAG: twin-arginine translocase TatA/TatE family subunit [Candidatus Eremiobacteraeota bacterium]|nr:twin-arginine translocase TatA/TatE family subunit [Candidatus Eremiobacteraeota bacterium]
MLSIPDMAVLGAAALLFFGPEQLPRVARKAGNVMREIQNTSASFIRELERAADVEEAKDAKPYEPPPYDAPYEPAADDAAPYEAAPYGAPYDTSKYEPPAPEPDAPHAAAAPGPFVAGEKLAEPRPALDLQRSAAAEPPPEPDHTPHL